MSENIISDEVFKNTRRATKELASLTGDQRNYALARIADALEASRGAIFQANKHDCDNAGDIPTALFNRLRLSDAKFREAVAGLRDLISLDDPIGKVSYHKELDDGLVLKRVACPLGVIGVIFEARPDVLIQISALAIKSGNGAILKGGSEASHTNQVILATIHAALECSDVPRDVVQLLTSRSDIDVMLKQDRYVDLIIPRGSQNLVSYIQSNTQIPVIGHADGICHLYVDQEADLQKAVNIAIDSKTQYPSACNAIETMLVNENIAEQFIPLVVTALEKCNVELRVDERTNAISAHTLAREEDWQTEYSDLILAIKIVKDIDEAIDHINTYGSGHTEAIITENQELAQKFFGQVDAANVFQNCSTRFADGFRYGFGAEVGISTQKMPPRGPVGLEGLVTFKYQLTGSGEVVADYSGVNAKTFKHRNLL